jgi:formamidopyrimidine-DNA glycosylase
MPEVVEVCMTTLYLKHYLLNKKIIKINVLSGRYKKTPMKGFAELVKKLPLQINDINSKGKFIWLESHDNSNKEHIMLNTLGLEGSWSFVKSEHSHIEFEFADISNDKKHLYFNDTRNFGTMEFTSDRNKLNEKLNELGEDLLKTPFTETDFRTRLGNVIKKKHGGDIEIVKVLMDQKKKSGVGSGIGNYLSVESLYKAKISPYTKAIDIYNNVNLCSKLSKSIKYIIKLSFMTAEVGYVGELDKDMIEWIKSMRKSTYNIHPDINIKNNIFVFNVYRKKKDSLGNDVVGDKIINGRTTYWCPAVQK